ncbi:MAG: LysE family translocator [Anaerolineaceae bacterium]|nr:LysE family translocator [Anaerolineaceae bacterium]
MDSWALLLTIAVAHVVIAVTPGPNFLIVLKVSVSTSRRHGLVTSLGVITGTGIYATSGFLGFAALLAHSAELLTILRWLGAIYLIYMGVQAFRANHHADLPEAGHQTITMTLPQAYRTGLLTMLSNPKAALYFFTLFTTTVPTTVTLEMKIIVISMLMAISLTWYTIVALSFSNRRIQALYMRAKRWLDRFFGGVFIVLGIRVAGTA